MAMHPIPPQRASANTEPVVRCAIVDAYLRARAEDDEDDAAGPDYGVECRLKQFARRGGDDYVMSWGINNQGHAALAALLASERLERLIEGYKTGGARGEPERLNLTPDVLAEVAQIREAMANVWEYFHRSGYTDLLPLAKQIGVLPPGFGPVGGR